ncbi:MAG: hypothetical protein COB50_02460 [Thiotrichales bacterium]|nr:MAG: hypothetical protein COB50_02460 [Thiotrichales bacterium]
MKNSIVIKAILLISGLILIAVGAGILCSPVVFFAADGVSVAAGNVDLLSTIRASGGALLSAGTLVIAGIFIKRLTFTSMLVSIVMYLSYGFSRIISMLVDGMPNNGLVVTAVIEIMIGMICVFAMCKYREKLVTG